MFKTPLEVSHFLNQIRFGWYGSDQQFRYHTLQDINKYYQSLSIEEILKYNTGICIDQTELARHYFKTFPYPFHTYIIKDIYFHYFHCFLIYQNKDYILFDPLLLHPFIKNGITSFQTLNQALLFAQNHFLDCYPTLQDYQIEISIYQTIPAHTSLSYFKKQIQKDCKTLTLKQQ